MADRIAEPEDFTSFCAFTAALGQNPLYAQGAGGNVSLKGNGAIWVKASGAWLKDAQAKNIFVVIDQANAATQLAKGEPVYRRLDNDQTLRPSIETSLHIASPYRIVVHVHAVGVMAAAVREDAEAECAKKLAGLHYVFIPYVKPGWPVTDALLRASAFSASISILGNHGLIVCGDSVAEVEKLLADISARFNMPVRLAPEADINFLSDAAGSNWRLPKTTNVHSLATDTISCTYAVGGTLYPDHAVFLGRGCRTVTADKLKTIDPASHPMILVEGKGVLLSAKLSSGGEAMAECLAAVLARIPAGTKLKYLSVRDEDEILYWDAEKFRQAVK